MAFVWKLGDFTRNEPAADNINKLPIRVTRNSTCRMGHAAARTHE